MSDPRISDGSHDLNGLMDKYGEWSECPEGCKPIN